MARWIAGGVVVVLPAVASCFSRCCCVPIPLLSCHRCDVVCKLSLLSLLLPLIVVVMVVMWCLHGIGACCCHSCKVVIDKKKVNEY